MFFLQNSIRGPFGVVQKRKTHRLPKGNRRRWRAFDEKKALVALVGLCNTTDNQFLANAFVAHVMTNLKNAGINQAAPLISDGHTVGAVHID